jgi:cytochrome c oxidase subunit 2
MRRVLFLAPSLLAATCSGTQSALAPAGPQAERIADLWWFFFSVLGVVYVLVAGATVVALMRRRRAAQAADGAELHGLEGRSDVSERRMITVIVACVAVTIVVLVVFLFASIRTGRALAALESPDPVRIEVVGHQWWWELRYLHAQPSKQFTTANELHLPAGQPVEIATASRDVIHSLWIPNLHGKLDLIPGRTGRLWIQADKPGVYRGQCAEFCGLQHAQMKLLVVVEPVEQYNAWLDHQRAPAKAPVTDAQKRGQDLFMKGPCVMCHTISGTPAMSRVGPPLSHFGSQASIAAGVLPNTPGYLGAWLADPQQLKPGARMPPTGLDSEDLQALIAYLHSLK